MTAADEARRRLAEQAERLLKAAGACAEAGEHETAAALREKAGRLNWSLPLGGDKTESAP